MQMLKTNTIGLNSLTVDAVQSLTLTRCNLTISITPIIYVLSTGNYLLQDFCGWCYENNNSKPTPLFFEPFRLQMA